MDLPGHHDNPGTKIHVFPGRRNTLSTPLFSSPRFLSEQLRLCGK